MTAPRAGAHLQHRSDLQLPDGDHAAARLRPLFLRVADRRRRQRGLPGRPRRATGSATAPASGSTGPPLMTRRSPAASTSIRTPARSSSRPGPVRPVRQRGWDRSNRLKRPLVGTSAVSPLALDSRSAKGWKGPCSRLALELLEADALPAGALDHAAGTLTLGIDLCHHHQQKKKQPHLHHSGAWKGQSSRPC